MDDEVTGSSNPIFRLNQPNNNDINNESFDESGMKNPINIINNQGNNINTTTGMINPIFGSVNERILDEMLDEMNKV